MELLDLNEDCLRYLFRFLDAEGIVAISETCTDLNNIAEDLFKFTKLYTCYIDSIENEERAMNTMKKIGKYLDKIGLMFEGKYRSHDELFETLTKSVEKKVELSVLGEMCSMPPFQILAPMLSQLETLTIRNTCFDKDCEDCISLKTVIDLPTLCQNLRELTVCGQVLFTPNHNKSFRSLELLAAEFDFHESPHTLFFQNRQLKKLKLSNRRAIKYITVDDLNPLVNLEELHLDVNVMELLTPEILKLSAFANLHTLWLYSINSMDFNAMVTNLATLKQLKDISLQSQLTRIDSEFSPAQESFIRIANELKELKSFVTLNIDWTSETVIEFVRQAKDLVNFDFWSGLGSNYIVTPTFIRELATTRKFTVAETMQPLNLKMYAMDNDLRQVILY